MRALVTGASGFVGQHLLEALTTDGWTAVPDATDLADEDGLLAALERARPDVVFHLAALSFVPDSLHAPEETYAVNVMGTARLSSALRAYAGRHGGVPRVLFTSSAEVYGSRASAEMPLAETFELRPANPYAASKAAAEMLLLGEMRALGGDVIIARAFNQIGPGQSEKFAVASFAHGLAKIAAGASPLLEVGNLDAQRDVLDVRDTARAYVALARNGERGEVYNVCRGTAVTMRDLLGELIVIARVPVEVRADPAKMRPSDTPLSFGSNAKLLDRTGWAPRIKMTDSLRDIYEDARKRLGP